MTTFVKDNVATILLNQEVEVNNSNEIVDFIYGVGFLDEVDTIKVLINSPGGSVMGGLSIFTALVASEKKVITQIDGIAASIAAVIFMAGQERYMMEYGLFMIHNPFGGSDQNALDKIKQSLMNILGEDNFNNLSELMDEETWLNAEEMEGLINSIIKVENGEMEKVTNKALELFEIVNQLKKEEMENEKEFNEEVENQESSMENEALESNIEERIEASEEAVEETVEEVVNEVEENNEEISEEVEAEVSEEEIEVEDEEVEAVVEEENVETEETEAVAEEQAEVELVENSVEEVSNVVELTNKLKEQEELISELSNKLAIYEKEASDKAKLSLLEKSNINPDSYNEWMDMDLEVIERLAGTVNKVAPTVESTDNKDKVWSIEEKKNLLKEDPAEYARLIRAKIIK